jgi:hypothetical protein
VKRKGPDPAPGLFSFDLFDLDQRGHVEIAQSALDAFCKGLARNRDQRRLRGRKARRAPANVSRETRKNVTP